MVTVIPGVLVYSRVPDDRAEPRVHSVYRRRDDWFGKDGALEKYAERFRTMVEAARRLGWRER